MRRILNTTSASSGQRRASRASRGSGGHTRAPDGAALVGVEVLDLGSRPPPAVFQAAEALARMLVAAELRRRPADESDA